MTFNHIIAAYHAYNFHRLPCDNCPFTVNQIPDTGLVHVLIDLENRKWESNIGPSAVDLNHFHIPHFLLLLSQ